ncbi:MAG: thioesterase family protein [Granulosicoccus sp.]
MTDITTDTLPPRSTDEQQVVESEIRSMFEHRITFNEFLGFRIKKLSTENISVVFDMRPELVGHYLFGRLHGGVISSVLDATGGLAVMWALAEFHNHESAMQIMDRFRHLGTIDLRVDYLRQGIGKKFTASATVVRLGKRIAAISMSLHSDDGRKIATGNATYIVS